MILPLLRGFLNFKKAPATWSLFIINLIFFCVTQWLSQPSNEVTDELGRDTYFIRVQGEIYAAYVDSHKANYSDIIVEIASKALEGKSSKIAMLGQMAFRDVDFMRATEYWKYPGDQVAFSWWNKQKDKLKELHTLHPSYNMGLSGFNLGRLQWFSYQFVHSGFVHFSGNMFFLLIFGWMLEPVIGGLLLLLIYFGSGLVAAATFLLINGVSFAPLVGASGAISGLMALTSALYWKKTVRYVYLLFIPSVDYVGFVYLPGWFCSVMWVLNDLAGYLSAIPELGGVAHMAHVGGVLSGGLVGLTLFLYWKFARADRLDLLNSQTASYPSGTLFRIGAPSI